MADIREFEAFPQYERPSEGVLQYTWRWTSKVSIDLAWVAGAMPGLVGDGSTDVILAGSGRNSSITVRCAYPDFMAMWMKAKGRQTSAV